MLSGRNCDVSVGHSRTILTHQNSILKEVKSRLNSGSAFYHSGQNFLSSSLLPKNTKYKTRRTTILYVVLYGRETCSLTLRRGGALRMFDDRKLRKVSGGLEGRVTGEWRKGIVRKFVT